MYIDNPLTEEQALTAALLPDGEYFFQVEDAKERISKSGNEMIEVKLKIVDVKSKREGYVFDYLLPAAEVKLWSFCAAINLLDNYYSGQLSAISCIGKNGQAKIGTQKDETGQYEPKNVVKKYIPKDKVKNDTKQASQSDTEELKDDDILF